MEFGVQIFGCLEKCKENPDTFFKELSDAGYKQIEPCILFDDAVKMKEDARINGNQFLELLADTIWKPEELPEYIQRMNKYGLKLSTVHVFANNMNQIADKMIETAELNHISAYIVNCNQQTVGLRYVEFAKECSELSLTLKEHGIELWIHNNGVEIKTRVEHNGKQVPVLSAILDLCKTAHVGAQIDVGWVLYGGIDPVQYLLQVKDYVRSIHFKDLKKDFLNRENGDIFACLGDGALNVKEILECIPSLNSDITVLVDQDASDGDIMNDLAKSYQVLDQTKGKLIIRRQTMNVSSTLETYDVITNERSTIFKLDKHLEAPNWTKDGNYIIYNSDGLIWKYDLTRKEHSRIDTGEIVACNNDHVLSPDGKEIAVSSMAPGTVLDWTTYNSYIYVLPLSGGMYRKVTPLSPSFLHGWSPDGKTLAYCAMRNNDKGNIYTIPVVGGEEKRLTSTEGLSDGPEYSADGKHIWFNSTKSGLMQIWRMDYDGGNQQQVTKDERNNWFPHVSPDNQKVVYISYKKGDVEPGDHPANKNVELNIMNYDGSENRVLVKLFGGQGTFNVNSWSPDSEKFAFVSYELK